MKLCGLVLLVSSEINAFKLSEKEASQILLTRKLRENVPINENSKFLFGLVEGADNLERECIEERCNDEELDEVYDWETGIFKVYQLPSLFFLFHMLYYGGSHCQ